MSAGTVVVGGGLAAAHTISTLRDHGYADPITLIGEEQELPYERPALSKDYLLGKTGELQVHDAGWYADHQVDVRTGVRATAVDRDAHLVRVGSELIPYEDLVLATGARPRLLPIPGADRPGVHTLRTRADSDRLREALDRDERWVIIGGGWIGLEVAAAAIAHGRVVTVLEHASLPLQRVLGDRLGRYFLDLHLGNGVDLRTGSEVRAIERSGPGLRVHASDGSIDADTVVMAVGAAPNTELAAGLAVDNGIVVDRQLRTADPHVLAAGDVATADNTALGRALRVEHWDNAIRQGRLAARTILGTGDEYDWQPYFFTDQYDLGMEYVGHGTPGDQVLIRGSLLSGEFIAFWADGERITAAMNVNLWDVNSELRGLVGRSVPAARLTDIHVPLTDL
ncbi:MAG TPA: FAD-dependent oxidoreductase [Mycobacteriales bacterium]|nr:FAD-dependent oxidoreductase [Mycobacteriales bacterium]